MASARAWDHAIAEHRASIGQYLEKLESFPVASWHAARGEGKWSPAAVTLHLIQSYELARAACDDNVEMQMRVSPAVAWVSRHFLLPLMFATGKFPGGAKAPREVRPEADAVASLSHADAAGRLTRTGDDAVRSIRDVALRSPERRVRHAYFGPLPLFTALRLLSAHTRHHARTL